MSYEHLLRPVSNTLLPPSSVRGMRILDREKFRKPLKVFTLLCPGAQLTSVVRKLKQYMLKLEKLKAIRLPESIPEAIIERNQGTSVLQNFREIIFNPLKIDSWHKLPVKFLENRNILADHFSFDEIELTYDNWGAAVILRSVLPLKNDSFKSFSCIGHIVHVNLREHLLPYKELIGQVLLDKVPNCRTVVHKSAAISNAFRFFEFELLCGEENYQVETKENSYRYHLDFSKVYWNPRLSTEHQRISDIIESHDVLYDVFAGIGPFAVPAASKGATVFANDLNPESVRWLKHNIELNVKNCDAQCFNMDGAVFIRDVVKPNLMTRWRSQSSVISLGYNMYIVMNLPGSALNFLSEFRGLFQNEADQIEFDLPDFKFPHIYCYTFAKGLIDEADDSIRFKVRKILRMPILSILKDIEFVRNVAPNTNMYRVCLHLNKTLLTTSHTIVSFLPPSPVNVIGSDEESDDNPDELDEMPASERAALEKEAEERADAFALAEKKEKEAAQAKEQESNKKQEQEQAQAQEEENVAIIGDNEAKICAKRSNASPCHEKVITDNCEEGDVAVKDAKKPKPSSAD